MIMEKFEFQIDTSLARKWVLSKYPSERKKVQFMPLLDLRQRPNNGWICLKPLFKK